MTSTTKRISDFIQPPSQQQETIKAPTRDVGVGRVRGLHHSQATPTPVPITPASKVTDTAAADAESDELTLRQFDLDTKFGPVMGMTRLQRFARAEQLNLSPPPYVKDLILKHGGEESPLNKHLFTEGKV